MDSNNIIDILLKHTEQLGAINAHLMELKEESRQEQKRQAQVEAELKYLHRQVNIAHGGLALLTLIGTIVGIWKVIG